ncbi:MAG TPA: glycine betaine ABC transporter substrate-binding protein [Solirubrobacteraceae bacterium]|jgi:osmoprotectant transport system substrate-binding protein|nr:glycine betaine ABC transporter substrate-binding protein [Solirubrobacteraceae bacterium]
MNSSKLSRLTSLMASGAMACALVAGVAACGSSSSSTSSSTSSSSASTSTPAAAASGPGVGKPAVTIGDKNFAEENILGALYAQALQAKGYAVTLKDNIGSSEIIYKALTSGQINMYPEYTGVLLSAVAGKTTNPASASAAASEANAFLAKQGATLLQTTPFYDSNVLATLPAYGSQHHLASIADLKPLGAGVRLGGPPEFATRFEGLPGLVKEYGVKPAFVPIAIELSYKALESGQVNVQNVFSTDGQLLGGKFHLLSDPKHVFGFQNVAPVVNKSVLAAEGPAFEQTLNKVSSLLTLKAIQQMNAAVSIDKQSATSVAQQFLKANGLS